MPNIAVERYFRAQQDLANAPKTGRACDGGMSNGEHIKTNATGLLLAGFLTAQQQPAQKQNNNERMKDCAAQAEKVMRTLDRREFSLIGNHYSPKYERCFVLISYRSQGYWERALSDAFEGEEWAAEALQVLPNVDRNQYCTISHPADQRILDESRACIEVRAYIDEHMNH